MKTKAWRFIEKGLYFFKNGITVKHEGKQWNVYYASGMIAYTGDTMKECKQYLTRRYC